MQALSLAIPLNVVCFILSGKYRLKYHNVMTWV